MPVPTALSDLSATPASNSPAATDTLSTADDYLRAHASIIARIAAGTDALTTVETTTVETTNIKANDGTASATIADSTGVMTIASAVLTTADINGGTLDGVTIGASAAPTVTNLGTVTTCDINGGTIDGVTIGASSAPTVTNLGSVATCDINGGTIGGVTLDGTLTGSGSPAVSGLGTVGCGAITSSGNLNVTGTISNTSSGSTQALISTGTDVWATYYTGTSTARGYVGNGTGIASGGAASEFGIRSEGDLIFSSGGATKRATLDASGNLAVLGALSLGSGTPTSKVAFGASVLDAGAGTYPLKWNNTTGAVTYDTSSRLVKDNIVDSPYGLAEVLQLQPRKYFRVDDQRDEIGFVADEVVGVLPEFVPMVAKSLYTKDEADTEIIPGGVNYEKLTAVLVKAVQELSAKNDALEARLAALEAA